MAENPVVYQKLQPLQVAVIKTHIDSREKILPLVKDMRSRCAGAACGDMQVIFHGGAVKDGFVIEVACPVSSPINEGEITTRVLEGAPALTMRHHGSHATIRETSLVIYRFLEEHAWTSSLFRREVYRVIDDRDPANNITEVQVILHEWDQLLADAVEEALGEPSRQVVMKGIEAITPSSSFSEYVNWIEGAIDRLDEITDDQELKCEVVSRCAHIFPQERIDSLREIYLEGGVDGVLREMYSDPFWYEQPIRRGNILYVRKNPVNPEGVKAATTAAERRKAYCHCDFVHPYLDEIPAKLSSTFCCCGAGWYRRLWQGITGLPVKIDHVETLLKGHDQCTMTITLPLDLTGECTPAG